jgi:hypothetical protein
VSDHDSFIVEFMDVSSRSLLEEPTTKTDVELLVPSRAGALASPHTEDELESPQPGSP